MGKFSKDIIIAEIDKRMSQFYSEKTKEGASANDKLSLGGRIGALEELKVFINGLDKQEPPKHSYFERIYHLGSEPRWKVGDTLGGYEFYSDREGTYILGEIVDVKMNEDKSDWIYTFKNEDIIEESELIIEGVCKIS